MGSLADHEGFGALYLYTQFWGLESPLHAISNCLTFTAEQCPHSSGVFSGPKTKTAIKTDRRCDVTLSGPNHFSLLLLRDLPAV